MADGETTEVTMETVPDKRKKRAPLSEEKRRAKRECDKTRGKTRVNLGQEFTRWRELRECKRFQTDIQLAFYLLDCYDKRSPTLMTSPGTCMQEQSAQSSLGRVSAPERGKQHQQDDFEHQSETTHMASEVDGLQDRPDLDSDMENILGMENTELSSPGADKACDEDVYVPVIRQRSKKSELLLECEEEELEPWQKHTLYVYSKEEDDIGELNDQTDCKPDPSSLQSWSAGQHTPTPEACGVVHTFEGLEPWQKHTLHVHVKTEADDAELNDQTDCKPDPSTLQSWSAGQHTPTPEACGVVHTFEGLEPWQKHTLHVQVKTEEDDIELNDQTDCKPDPSSLQSWSAGQHTPTPEACGVVHTFEQTLHVHVKTEEDDVELSMPHQILEEHVDVEVKPDPSSLQG